MKNKIKNLEKRKKTITIIIIKYKKKTRKTTKLQQKKQYELNTRRTLIGKQNESNREIKQNEKRQKGKI